MTRGAKEPQASSRDRSEPSGRVIGIDVGSSSVKALVLAGDGSVVECVSAAHALVPTPGAVEADANGWWDATIAALRQLRTPLSGIAAVGLSGNMSSVVLLDEAREPLRPAPLLADPAALPSWPRSTRRCAPTSPRCRATPSRPSPRSPHCCGCATTTPRPSPARGRGCTRRTSSACG